MRRRELPLYFTLAVFALSANAVPPLISTLSVRLSLPAWALGLGITFQYVSFTALSWLGGAYCARRGIPYRVMVLAGLVVLALTLAFAPFLLVSLPALLLWMCVLGLAGGSVETFASVGLTEDSPSASSKSLCLSQAFYAVGAFAAPQAASVFLELAGGWKIAFALFGSLAAAVTVFYALFGRGGGPALGAPSPEKARGGEAELPARRGGSVSSFRFLIFAYAVTETFCGSWIPFMLENGRGFSARDAAATSSYFWLGMMAGRLAIPLLPDRLTLHPALAGSSLLAAAAALVLLLFPASSLLSLSVLGFAMGPIWPVAVRMAAERLRSPSLTASVIASGGLGAVAGPLFGSLLLAGGLARLYFPLIIALCILVASVVAISLSPRRRPA